MATSAVSSAAAHRVAFKRCTVSSRSSKRQPCHGQFSRRINTIVCRDTTLDLAALTAHDDENVLTTALNRAIVEEDYAAAAKLSARLKTLQGLSDVETVLDWRGVGIAEWLCARAEQLGYTYPTAIQRRATLALLTGKHAVIMSQTGSGKTMAYLVPTIDSMDFTARRMLQVLVVVPTRELTIQTVMLAYKLLGGSIRTDRPGNSTNMFSYFGPQGVRVKVSVCARRLNRNNEHVSQAIRVHM